MSKLSLLPAGKKGFTLVEMVVVIAVLAILVTISTPAIYQFLRQRDRQSEENYQAEIRKALQAYLADTNELPDPSTWSTDLGGYTNLSVDEISTDVWRQPRAYIMYKDPSRNLQGTPVEVYYATIISSGPDRIATAVQGISVAGTAFGAISNASWWANDSGNEVTRFSSLAVGGDDILTRFTDYPEKLERYNITLQRLDRIAQAIESYAKNGYANKVVACGNLTRDPDTGLTGDATCDNGAPEKIVYYPKSQAVNAQADSAVYYNTTQYVNNAQGDGPRRSNMVTLMRLLGLPDDFCCSALTLGTDGQPRPFYYFSNPRPRAASGGCGTRPDANTMKLPARITTQQDDSASLNPTCG